MSRRVVKSFSDSKLAEGIRKQVGALNEANRARNGEDPSPTPRAPSRKAPRVLMPTPGRTQGRRR